MNEATQHGNKRRIWLLSIGVLVLLVAAIATTVGIMSMNTADATPPTSPAPSPTLAIPSPTPSPSTTETYGECVAGITMDPNDVQRYIDQVHQECGQLDGAPS